MSDVKDIAIGGFDYPLPDNRIASHPLAERDQCLLLIRKPDGTLIDSRFDHLPSYVPDGAIMVFNNTRVINARLRFRKGADNSGALIEIFCLEPSSPADYAVNFASTGLVSWNCFVGNSKRWKDGELTMTLTINGRSITLSARRIDRIDNSSIIEFSWDDSSLTFADIISTAGEIPVPPYLNRPTEEADLRDYQTVYSAINGSVAAPTAGLHFTPTLLDHLRTNGVELRNVTLHVGAGTFQPVKSESIGDHLMHSEFITVDIDTINALAQNDGHRPVFAVGTTSVRTLESLYHAGCLIATNQWDGEVPQWYPYSPSHPNLSLKESLTALADYTKSSGNNLFAANTRIIIAPDYHFRVVNAIVTNFHQPQSTLLLLVSAFVDGNWRAIYDHALANQAYRFLSYGDACLLL
ncbi:MAG: S-adenosylmethionine:tRNA ribosyltransferase-isomerase [Muribaculaceae bacterium]|nr:S-adenosylmethionine:tRNA ribosyltransferase-isomerase [Muribaculaceae bacterium]